LKNFKRNIKAISPIFATLILIAIAVIAGVVVYMFTSGTLATMTGGGTAASEKLTVQASSISVGTGVTVYIEQTGGPAATINSLIVKDISGNTVDVITSLTDSATIAAPGPLTNGLLTTITGTITSTVTLTAGSSYTVTVTTSAGGNFVGSSVIAVA
jgi:flagellin-like protein